MNINRPVCFYHPVKTLFLDDDNNFLKMLEISLGDAINFIATSDYVKAKSFLADKKYNINDLVFETLDKESLDTDSDQVLDLNLKGILELLYNQNRFDICPVAVVDFNMPALTGIEFCESIRNLPILKLMLTAEADKDLAIEAFNNGVIDQFILKQDKNLSPRLLLAIERLNVLYFENMSKRIYDSLDNEVQKLMSSHDFLALFNELLKASNAIEFYLIDKFGSYIFLDAFGKTTYLIIVSAKELKNRAQLYEDLGGSEEISNSIRKNQQILFLGTDEQRMKPIRDWILLESRHLADGFYYAISNDLPIGLHKNKVLAKLS